MSLSLRAFHLRCALLSLRSAITLRRVDPTVSGLRLLPQPRGVPTPCEVRADREDHGRALAKAHGRALATFLNLRGSNFSLETGWRRTRHLTTMLLLFALCLILMATVEDHTVKLLVALLLCGVVFEIIQELIWLKKE